MGFSSYGIFEMVLDEANSRFAPIFKPNAERLSILKEYCCVIDQMIEENGGETFEVDIDENNMAIHMAIGLKEIIDEDPKHSRFLQVIQRATAFKVKNDKENEQLVVYLTFPSVWEKTV